MLSKKIMPLTNECAVCAKFGSFYCERCGETYCSQMCQLTDWRDHRRICMRIPRLMQRADISNNLLPLNRMLMDSNANANGFDSIDAIGSVSDKVSEHSLQSEVGAMTKEQIAKLTTSLNKLQIEANTKVQQKDMKSSLAGIEEVLSTPPSTPTKKIDNNSNYSMPVNEVPVREKPKVQVVLTPPSKKAKNFKPWIQSIQTKIGVLLAHVEDHKTVFVIPSYEVEQWTTLINRVNEHASYAKPLKNPPEIGHVVLVKPKASDLYSRALIKKIRAQDEVAKVEFMEYGFTEVIKFTEMKCLSEELVNTPRLVNMITLKGVPDEMENASGCIQFLVTLQEKKTELIVHHLDLVEKSNLCVHWDGILLDNSDFKEINKMVKEITANANKPAQNIEMEELPEPQIEQPQSDEPRQINFPGFSGKNLDLFILDNSFIQIGCFCAIKTSDMGLLSKNDATVNELAKEIEAQDPYYPRVSETCLAQSKDDKRWYRARCQQKVDKDLFNVLYFDYGNMEEVPVDRIRPISTELAFPCISSICFIDGLGDSVSPDAANRLKKLLEPYTQVVFDEVAYTGEEATCKSTEIVNILKNEGLI